MSRLLSRAIAKLSLVVLLLAACADMAATTHTARAATFVITGYLDGNAAIIDGTNNPIDLGFTGAQSGPLAITVGPGNIIYAAVTPESTGVRGVRRYDAATNSWSTFLGPAQNVLAPIALAFAPTATANSNVGDLFLTQYLGPGNSFLQRFSSTGTLLGAVSAPADAALAALTFSPDGTRLYATTTSQFPGTTLNSVQVYDLATGTLSQLGASLNFEPGGIAVGPDGNLYVSKYIDPFTGHQVAQIDPNTGAVLNNNYLSGGFPGGSGGFSDLAFDTQGNLYVADRTAGGRILQFGPTGSFLGTFYSSNDFNGLAAGTVGIALIPEPTTSALMIGAGLTALALARRRRRAI